MLEGVCLDVGRRAGKLAGFVGSAACPLNRVTGTGVSGESNMGSQRPKAYPASLLPGLQLNIFLHAFF